MLLRMVIAAAFAGSCLVAAADKADEKPAPVEKSRPHIRFGGIMINAGYSHFSGPGYPYRYGGYGYPGYWGYGPFYDPFFYGAYLHPGFYTGYGYQPSMGELKVQGADKESWVYLDGALAGRAEKLKTMWLEPGAYQLEVRTGTRRVGQKVYVLSGKTLKVTPEMMEVRP